MALRGVPGSAFAAGALGACTAGQEVVLGLATDADGSAAGATSGATGPPSGPSAADAVSPPAACVASPDSPASCDAASGASDTGATALDSSSGSDGSTGPGPADSAPAPLDSATGTGASFCLTTPSFEFPGPPGRPVAMQLPPYPWQQCNNFGIFPVGSDAGGGPTWPLFPVPNPGVSSMSASDGSYYIGLTVGSYGPTTAASESVGTPLCSSPLQAGTTYSVSVDLAMAVTTVMVGASNQPAVLEIWGSKNGCTKDERLWVSPIIMNKDKWQMYCALFRPTQSFSFLTLVPAAPAGFTFAMGQWSYVVVDHLVPGATCK
jgi:hypothetical protein